MLIYLVLNLVLQVFDLIDDLVHIRLLENIFTYLGFELEGQIISLEMVSPMVIFKLVAQAVPGEIPLETIG